MAAFKLSNPSINNVSFCRLKKHYFLFWGRRQETIFICFAVDWHFWWKNKVDLNKHFARYNWRWSRKKIFKVDKIKSKEYPQASEKWVKCRRSSWANSIVTCWHYAILTANEPEKCDVGFICALYSEWDSVHRTIIVERNGFTCHRSVLHCAFSVSMSILNCFK